MGRWRSYKLSEKNWALIGQQSTRKANRHMLSRLFQFRRVFVLTRECCLPLSRPCRTPTDDKTPAPALGEALGVKIPSAILYRLLSSPQPSRFIDGVCTARLGGVLRRAKLDYCKPRTRAAAEEGE